ncbi:S-ribosylhomocysteine lyase [Oscillospiraceae bacterium LTW-04]|nr:S-ribosylhomocysteine lyase [Oscillospiraceae bacterium MB24-C1]
MEKIASFCINHDTLTPGIYTSRIDFGDIITYDIRYHYPNAGSYLSPEAAHTIEHIFATWVRSSNIGSQVVYFGPMGCLTGFYLILKGVKPVKAVAAISEGMRFVRDYQDEIPGALKVECGNYKLHNLPEAKKEATAFCNAITDWNEERLTYPK